MALPIEEGLASRLSPTESGFQFRVATYTTSMYTYILYCLSHDNVPTGSAVKHTFGSMAGQNRKDLQYVGCSYWIGGFFLFFFSCFPAKFFPETLVTQVYLGT